MLFLLSAFGGGLVVRALQNYERYGLEAVVLAVVFMAVITAAALYQSSGDPENWPKRD